MQNIWREAMTHYVFMSDIMKDVSKVIDYLKGWIATTCHIILLVGGGIEIEQLHKGGTEIEKNHFSSKPL